MPLGLNRRPLVAEVQCSTYNTVYVLEYSSNI